MFLNATSLEKLTLVAQDGEMGKIKDLYFDDENYTIRYLTIASEKWFPDQIIYLSPSAISRIDFDKKVIEANHTIEDLREGAGLRNEKEMDPEKEAEFADRFNWSQYWAGESVWGEQDTPLNSDSEAASQQTAVSAPERSNHLRSVNHMKGVFSHADVFAGEEHAGYITDVLIEEETWIIRYFVVSTGSWSTHPFTLISPDWIEEANWSEDQFQISLTLEGIEKGPMYQKNKAVTRGFEEELYQSYGKAAYWK
ncbi:PRC-barrel domain-containing protein [Halobacillus sp. K22]|uniref:PRC-barrel domain-containing protein n=1 Tax=Halobacillus sp. K22 TaxID=3457431 RepID=UPI003FCCFE31